MEPKKRQIMEAALALFAEKGYHDTSIQEIADRIGIAKGSIYTFFRSKEELMTTIFEYYHQHMYEKLRDTLAEQVPPRDKMERLITQSLEQFVRFKMFIFLQRKEAHLQQKRELKEMIFDFRAKRFFTYRHIVSEVYGSQAEPYWLDLAAVLSGMTFEFMNYTAFDKKHIDYQRVSGFIMSVLDASAEHFMKRKTEPLLTDDMMNDFIRAGRIGISPQQQELLNTVWKLKDTIAAWDCDVKHKEEAEQAYTVLESEVLKGNGDSVKARAMAMFLQSMPNSLIHEAVADVFKGIVLLTEAVESGRGLKL
ncbi:TetR/AcrR family transcriptional regulator [Paenibacillus sp. ACRRX]|uniref:TetR/AcrR family transcriptional regulator n=1 Tax=unclassified Paenibacillus TaxID=185978 RepID=UPI001EF63C2B|nr:MULTISPECIES: TetR/AcrR family transcriptional regulator [unclassified Paenibacillus]MCG7408567.1 TetR/AcrR family transcriptional regulator [Paenibacillus sp. ACRRX]MDK8182815.1 TetR/AcrR family transcriptional regulator [Paenibacillus sp. UMB4589-SE434]